VDAVRVALPLQNVRQNTDDKQHQAVPHPQQSPVPQDDGMMSFTEPTSHDLRNLATTSRHRLVCQECLEIVGQLLR
jgi:hypothetical protein